MKYLLDNLRLQLVVPSWPEPTRVGYIHRNRSTNLSHPDQGEFDGTGAWVEPQYRE